MNKQELIKELEQMQDNYCTVAHPKFVKACVMPLVYQLDEPPQTTTLQCEDCRDYGETDDNNCECCFIESMQEENERLELESADKERAHLIEYNLCKDTVRENKLLRKALENARLPDETDIWFISWLNDNICSGKIIGYEFNNGGYVIATDNSLISAEKVYLTESQAALDKLKGE